jgi:hypothetical protein
MLRLEVVGPGGSLSTLLLPRLFGETPSRTFWQASMATLADICDQTPAVLVLWLGGPLAAAMAEQFKSLTVMNS